MLFRSAASRAGIKEIFKVGGAQAIAAMAYGTETIPRVRKIFGPGNAWVTTAKTLKAALWYTNVLTRKQKT